MMMDVSEPGLMGLIGFGGIIGKSVATFLTFVLVGRIATDNG